MERKLGGVGDGVMMRLVLALACALALGAAARRDLFPKRSAHEEGTLSAAAPAANSGLGPVVCDTLDCPSYKIAMTAPVLWGLDVDRKASSRREVVFADRFSVSFFVPFRYQNEPPTPKSSDVELVDTKELDIFVRSFDGYATSRRVHREAREFLRDLDDARHRIDDRTVYVAQYSPPFQPVFRYNEVWVLRSRRRSPKNDASADAAEVKDS
ncbi:Heme-binding protein 2 [Tetrabaena socialis]|uniref:Heme-binding protein 2 n=1 Tax=Tetrabaena socialis TaxID=47790 RepID=A0A2J8AEA6_9CHLO|nr:Heme-binding protein 2 [Tetrabaena socialis]|eukprot:PNH10847.1 Heme-binding protein 2 [Tetrabaena socialis]